MELPPLPVPPNDDGFTPDEVASLVLYECEGQTVRQWARDGLVQAVNAGSETRPRWRIPPKAVEAIRLAAPTTWGRNSRQRQVSARLDPDREEPGGAGTPSDPAQTDAGVDETAPAGASAPRDEGDTLTTATDDAAEGVPSVDDLIRERDDLSARLSKLEAEMTELRSDLSRWKQALMGLTQASDGLQDAVAGYRHALRQFAIPSSVDEVG